MESTSNGDLLGEILLRLPVKTLVRFKCVCKQWCSLIGSQRFVTEHFEGGSNRERLLIRVYIPKEERRAIVSYADETFEEPQHLQMPDTIAEVMGPLNGVFCLVNTTGSIALLNPATNQLKPLPALHPNILQPRISPLSSLLGFGLDQLTGDYKLVLLQFYWNDTTFERHYPFHVSVYHSGADTWRRLEDADLVPSSHFARGSLSNTYLNGFYYWLMKSNDFNASILAFDMASDKFKEINVPDCVKSQMGDLTVCADSLVLLSLDSNNIIGLCIDVWVLEKEGWWAKRSTVGPFVGIDWPLGLWKSELLLITRRTSFLTVYNVSTKKLTTVEAQGFRFFSYKESLVSLKTEGSSCKLWDPDYVKQWGRD